MMKMHHTPLQLTVLSCVVFLLTACQGSLRKARPSGQRIAQFTKFTPAKPQLQEDQERRVEANCPFGHPESLESWNHGLTQYIYRDGYVLEHSARDKIPLWVCEGVTPEQLDGDVKREDDFRPEPELPEGTRAELKDYRNSGYDRGHMAPAGDQKRDEQRMSDTFFLSNIVPQNPDNNRHIWAALEEKVRGQVRDHGSACLITGPMFYDPQEEEAHTADGLIGDSAFIGDNKVSVPTHLYKLVVSKNGGEWKATAYVLENKAYPKDWGDLEQYTYPIDWLEQRVGFDFMPCLTDEQKRALEEGHLTVQPGSKCMPCTPGNTQMHQSGSGGRFRRPNPV